MTYKLPYTIPEIIKMQADGQTYSQIAKHFGISSARVGQIIKRERQRLASTERAQCLCQQIRASNDLNDLDKKLSLDDLFCLLELSRRAEMVLRAYFNRQGITEFSLRNMMDFLIPAIEKPGDFYDIMPAYKVKMLGQILYAAMIKGLSHVDCGEAFRAEWTARKRRLRDYLLNTGSSYPYILNGKGAALLEPY